MATIDYSVNKRKETDLIEETTPEREQYLLKSLLYLLLYTGQMKGFDGMGDMFKNVLHQPRLTNLG